MAFTASQGVGRMKLLISKTTTQSHQSATKTAVVSQGASRRIDPLLNVESPG